MLITGERKVGKGELKVGKEIGGERREQEFVVWSQGGYVGKGGGTWSQPCLDM